MTEGTAGTAVPQPPPTVLEPTRDLRATLPELLDSLLDKGVYLNLDLIITVADIPLIGVNLRAVIAGMETMLEHGMMRSWDERTREWVRRSLARRVPLADDEDVVARMFGGHRQDAPAPTWRPGTVYLTSRRLMVWRADPRELLWEAPLEAISGVALVTEQTVGGEERSRVAVTTPAGTTVLSAAAPERLEALLHEHAGIPVLAPDESSDARSDAVLEASAWYLEELAGGSVWRSGTALLDRTRGLRWKGADDARPAVRVRPAEIGGIDVVPGRTPMGDEVITVDDGARTVRLAVEETRRWAAVLGDVRDSARLRLPEGGVHA